MGHVEVLHAGLALLAARFVLPGIGPDVDQAITLACELLAQDLDTPATVEVAALSYGTPLRDTGTLIREMLQQQGFPAPGPVAGEAEEFRAVLRALATGGLQAGEFFVVILNYLPAWEKQDELDRRLVVLLDDWTRQTTPQGRSAAAEALRAVAREAVSQSG